VPAAPLKPLICLPPLHFQVIIKYYRCLGSNVKEIDDTPVPESESEWDLDAMFDTIAIQIRQLKIRIAKLEARKNWQGHQDENDDPEWYA